MPTKQLIVIGAGMGGLSAAIHARLLGRDVLVLEKGASSGGKAAGISIAGYELDPGPSIIILTEIYAKVFERAGRKMEDYLQFRRLDTISRVFFEGSEPLDLPANLDQCLAVLRDLSPRDADAMAKLLDQVESAEPLLERSVYHHGFSQPWQILNPYLLQFGMKLNPTKPFKQLVDQMFDLPLLRAFFYGFPSYGGQTYHSSSPGSFLIPYYMLKRGVFFPVGGVRAIPLAFYRLAVELGVEFLFNREAVSFSVEGDRVVSLTDQHGAVHQADTFGVNFDRSTFAGMVGHPVTALPSYSYFTMHLGVRKEVPGLKHHNLFVTKDFERGFRELYESNRFPSKPIVYLNATGAEDPDSAPIGKTNLFAVVTSPSQVPGIDWAKETVEYAQRVRSVLSSFGISWMDDEVDFERIQNPPYFESAHGNFRGSLYGLEEKRRLWGIFPAANIDRRWRNVAFCGGSVQPGAGLPMVTLSGKFAIDALNRRKC